ncbi:MULTISPECIES: hypothetical protein [unclassified Bradyrhizobium]|uniref:hypothetical protein n=1 Tax=unclassified Bradyrhizobium TaxID=2631580 RepID=UPI0024787AB6|nr:MULTISPECIES: hypothetical protein [unclassified Bradyrhizobium]WGR72765.1 hypothetical protein MTX24_07610 [Bradyrhizobium sp. ISRA426]WGR77600.1 hypothetical protein MTX21_32565 [Bradyrhizobium sp. ISRA430]WGR88005.1 hypothetical protein MTX25_07615 [Bradyrhizobium sp. ISRA432]
MRSHSARRTPWFGTVRRGAVQTLSPKADRKRGMPSKSASRQELVYDRLMNVGARWPAGRSDVAPRKENGNSGLSKAQFRHLLRMQKSLIKSYMAKGMRCEADSPKSIWPMTWVIFV